MNTPTNNAADIQRILERMRLQIDKARDVYQPPEVRLGALVTVASDATLVATRLAGYRGDYVYLGPERSSEGSKS